jgi:stage V sporulation protein R
MTRLAEPIITSRTDWTEDLLHEVFKHIEDIAINDMRLDVYPNQIEVISAEQMIDAYSSVGLPVHYNHWSFGKGFMEDMQKYQSGKMGLAYEIVINSDPCISYLMEENPAITQALVIAHAAFGHNYVFKNNYMFKEWTQAGSIIDYMIFAKNYVRQCEERYGEDEVERVLDAAHALASHGVDKRKRKYSKPLSEEARMEQVLKQFEDEQKNLDIVMKKMSLHDPDEINKKPDQDRVSDEENLLYFIEKNAPNLEKWKRELIRIVYKIQQYFYPQGQTKTLNEGFATFTHYYIMNELEARGVISSDAQIAWLHLHSNVIYQGEMTNSFNPYALGFAIFQDIKRICEGGEWIVRQGERVWDPITDEDREWFPQLIGMDWRDAVKEAASEYRDESFIQQYLSPRLIRKWRMFAIHTDGKHGVVEEVSDDVGYRNIRSALAAQYNTVNYIPEISVRAASMKKDRKLTLEYKPFNSRTLYDDYARKVMKHTHYLWGYPVEMVQLDGKQERVLYQES